MVAKYQLNSNYHVFTIHPCDDLILEDYKVNLTNFGGEKVYVENNQVVYPFHKYGYLMAKPLQINNIKKVLAMAFEYLLDNNHNASNGVIIDPSPEFDMICVNCGSENFQYKEKRKLRWQRGSKAAYYYPSCKCSDCGHESHLDYCWNCKTKLFKHGSYWDYHRTSIWSIFDIHCPCCGMTLADRPQTVEY